MMDSPTGRAPTDPLFRQLMQSTSELASPLVMSKVFGITPHQAQRVQALLRLGLTEQDLLISERYFEARDTEAKIEWLLGCSSVEMSRLKALEVLGISPAMLEQERAQVLSSLGIKARKHQPHPGISSDPDPNGSSWRHVFGKRRHNTSKTPESSAPAKRATCCELAKQVNVTDLEDQCLSQHLRIQQLELQVAALTESSDGAKENDQ